MKFKDIEKVLLAPYTNYSYKHNDSFPELEFNGQVTLLPDGTEVVYTFWNVMHLQTQVHILELCSCCESLDSLIVFRDQNWRRPADIFKHLEELGDFLWTLHRRSYSMQGSCERKTVWVFFRD